MILIEEGTRSILGVDSLYEVQWEIQQSWYQSYKELNMVKKARAGRSTGIAYHGKLDCS